MKSIKKSSNYDFVVLHNLKPIIPIPTIVYKAIYFGPLIQATRAAELKKIVRTLTNAPCQTLSAKTTPTVSTARDPTLASVTRFDF